jgi:hypothetical protein
MKFKFGDLSWSVSDMVGSTKAGPNGQATLYSHIDALAINSSVEVYNNLKKFCSVTGSEKLMVEVDKYIGVYKDTESHKVLTTSKLSFLSEDAGKTRTIAIPDFWTQQALLKIHKDLYRFLAMLETDGTYSHNRVSSITRDMTNKGKACHSFDLTTATDRFPRILEGDLIAAIGSKELGDA